MIPESLEWVGSRLSGISVASFGLLTRSGAQCAVCSGWQRPCPHCETQPIATLSESDVTANLIGFDAKVAMEDCERELSARQKRAWDRARGMVALLGRTA